MRADGSAIHQQRFSGWFQQTIRRAGLLRIRLHGVRHSYVTAGLAADINKIMSTRFGHTDPAFTPKVYQEVLREMNESAAEIVATVILSGS